MADAIMDNGYYHGIGAVVLDFDGTTAKIDVCDAIMQFSKTDWKKVGALHDEGDISHAELNRRFVSMLTKTPDEIKSFLKKDLFLRAGAVNLICDLQRNNVPVFVVSGGWDLYIEDILSREGGMTNLAFLDRVEGYSVANTNILSNHLSYDGGAWNINPPAIPSSFKSSPCKKEILQELRSKVTGKIIFVGDGSTDFTAAEVADIVFARAQLAAHCKKMGVPYHIYNDLNDVRMQMLKITEKVHYGETLKLLRSKFFLDPTGSNLATVSDTIISSLAAVVKSQGDGPTYPMMSERQTPSQSIRSAALEAKVTLNPKEFLAKALPTGLQGGVKAGHPSMVKNIIPTPSTLFLSAHLAASVYAQNGVTGEDSAEAANSELKIAAVLSDLAGYSRELSAGIFTFGGTGTNMYGIKMGLAKACPHHAAEGIREKVCVVGSKPAHYSHVTASDWLGIGQNNYLYTKSHVDQSTDLEDLEKKCRGVVEEGGKLACIIGVAGTTSNMAIDDFKAIKSIRDKLVDDYGLEYTPHIHADSVVGWPYLYFTGYDFKENTMGFSSAAIQRIKAATARISTLSHADSFGVDFHKTGFMPYIASMVICKNESNLRVLGRDAKIMTPPLS